MSSSCQSKNLTGLDIVSYVANPKRKIGEALALEREQSPLVISLLKHPRQEKISRTSDNMECAILNEASFKLPKNCFQYVFTLVEQLPVVSINTPAQGFRRSIFWSQPINFRLPEDSMDRIVKMNEAAKTRDMDYLPLLERLEGWIIEKRQREKSEKYDMYFHHKKSQRTFRSFIEVETFIIDGSSPKEKKHKVAVEPWTSGSSKQVSFGIKRRDRLNDRQIVEKFLKEAWSNLQNGGTRIEDTGSSTIDHQAHAKQTHDEAYSKPSSFRPRKHRNKKTSSDNFDEDQIQKMMEELKSIMDESSLMLAENEDEHRDRKEMRRDRISQQGRSLYTMSLSLLKLVVYRL